MTEQRQTHSDLLAEVDDALREQPKTFRQEMRELIEAPKGSELAKARSGLGWAMILLGLFGMTALFFVIVVIGAIIGAIG